MIKANSVFIISLGIIVLGYLLKRFKFLTELEGKTISKFLMHTTFPALMLISSARVNIEPGLFLIPILCLVFCTITISIAWFLFRKEPTALRAVLVMGAGGLNVGLFGFPLIEGIWGTKAMLYAVMFDIGNTIITFGVVYPIGNYFYSKGEGKVNLKKLVKRVVSLPPVMGMLIGLIINFSNIELPEIAYGFLDTLAKANKSLVLLLMGIYLSFELDKSMLKQISKVLFIRLAVGLIAVYFLYTGLEPSLMRSVLIALVILPLGMTILPFSDEFNFDSRVAGTMVNLSLIISFIILWTLVYLLDLA
jgi:malate permease and related proteins